MLMSLEISRKSCRHPAFLKHVSPLQVISSHQQQTAFNLKMSVFALLCRSNEHKASMCCLPQYCVHFFQTFKQLSRLFAHTLPTLCLHQRVVLFLDSIDQLDVDLGARLCQWLPVALNQGLRVIISTLPEEKYEVMPSLQVRYPQVVIKGSIKKSNLYSASHMCLTR